MAHCFAQWGPVCLTALRYAFHFCISSIVNLGASGPADSLLFFLGLGALPVLLRVILPSFALGGSYL